jgi:hypothetical protein
MLNKVLKKPIQELAKKNRHTINDEIAIAVEGHLKKHFPDLVIPQ